MPHPDLELPPWGPYTKKYLGISHLTDQARGLRFDLSVFPGLYRRRVDVPRVTWESGYHPWEASADLNYFCHRHEVEWKDRIYADISFSRVDEDVRLVRAELVNATDLMQTLTLQAMASLHFPPVRTYSEEPLEPGTVVVPPGARWVGALDYVELRYARPRPQDHLGADGLWRAEARDHGFVDGQAIGLGFGLDPGDTVAWDLVSEAATPLRAGESGALLVRYRLAAGESLEWAVEGCLSPTARWVGTGDFATARFHLDSSASGRRFRLTSRGGAAVEIDGLVWGTPADLEKVVFGRKVWNPVGSVRPGPTAQSLTLHYEESDVSYGLAWQDEGEIREFRVDELDRSLRHYVHEHVKKSFDLGGSEHFANLSLRPLTVPARSTRVVWLLVAVGTNDTLAERLTRWPAVETVWRRERSRAVRLAGNPAGEPYRFSQEKLAATLLTNVVFPVYTRRQYIRHFTPGKWWDCLYTWDSGFIGLGFLEFSTDRAIENLKVYLTDPGDDHAAFLHHGSPVPVQFALFHELWNRTSDLELARWAYPRLRQYYRFLAGKEGGSTTGTLRSGLLQTWDYFYNSGGWDDYPPQVAVHARGLTASVAPVITSAQVVLCGGILAAAARALGLAEEADEYRADGERLSRALQSWAWDDAASCFSYVVHDASGTPQGFFRHQSGENFNRGLDGFYPLIAGICTPEQEVRIIALLESDRYWTEVGLSTVDRRAPYYRHDGYWNGAVWMAHQWYFWKALLDLGRGDFAWKIAQTALENARRETGETYCCFEHWIIEGGRGAGWHQFSGLSAPLLSWFGAYFVPGRLSTGFHTRVVRREQSGDGLILELLDGGPRARQASVVLSLPPGRAYRALWNGRAVPLTAFVEGAWGAQLPVVPGEAGLLEIESRPGPDS